MATEILRRRGDVLASVPARIRHNYRRRPQSNSDPKSKPPFRKSSPKPPAADAAAAVAAAKIIKDRKMKTEMYAGSAFSVSPAPSSVPLPSFRVSRREPSSLPPQAVDYVATRDLRRILRL